MALFTRNKAAVETTRGSEAAFESLKRSPRQGRARADGDADAAPLDPAVASKSRARRRLIGAIALALAAIVLVPMLFDRTPVAPNDDIALLIPDRDTPFEGRRGVPDPARGPLKAAPEPSMATVPEAAPPNIVEPPREPVASVEKSIEAPAARATPKPPERAAEKFEQPTEKSAPPVAESHAAGDDPRALAALEGRSAPPATETAAERGYAVQVAAFSAAEKARGLRDQLVGNGLRSYVESVSTAQGLRTRVRLGPFPSRDAADRAKQKLKTMKLDGSVVPL